jgi:hypothetical protein
VKIISLSFNDSGEVCEIESYAEMGIACHDEGWIEDGEIPIGIGKKVS